MALKDLQIILNNIFQQEEKFDSESFIPIIINNFKKEKDQKNIKTIIDIIYALSVLSPNST
jgi:hypothetical protein